jgi:hypothetical protein
MTRWCCNLADRPPEPHQMQPGKFTEASLGCLPAEVETSLEGSLCSPRVSRPRMACAE